MLSSHSSMVASVFGGGGCWPAAVASSCSRPSGDGVSGCPSSPHRRLGCSQVSRVRSTRRKSLMPPEEAIQGNMACRKLCSRPSLFMQSVTQHGSEAERPSSRLLWEHVLTEAPQSGAGAGRGGGQQSAPPADCGPQHRAAAAAAAIAADGVVTTAAIAADGFVIAAAAVTAADGAAAAAAAAAAPDEVDAWAADDAWAAPADAWALDDGLLSSAV